jgi:iron complex transport system ATP-binding protein
LGHRFGDRAVLEDVNVDLSSGELVVALGPNGAGKTTLLRALSGVLAPDRGDVELDTQRLSTLSRRAVARRIAVIPQDLTVPFPFRVREMVAMGRAPRLGALGREGSTDRDAVESALVRMGLGALSERLFPTLSAGERQRVLLARALAQDAPLLLLDEPTAHMDLGHRLFVFESLQEWIAAAPEGRAVLVVTHDLTLAAAFADVVFLLHDGRVVSSGRPEEVLTPARLGDVYAADVDVSRDAQNRPLIVALRSRIRYPARPDGPHR